MRKHGRFGFRLGKALACRRGTSATEFALVAPPLFLILVGILEVGMILLLTTLMEGSVREAARFGITGYQVAGQSRADTIRAIVAERTVGLVDMDQLQISYQVYQSFEQIGQAEPFVDGNANGVYDAGESFVDVNGNGAWDADMGVAGVGGPGDVVVYTLTYNWPLMTGLLTPLLGEAGSFPIRAAIAVRNEPYGTTIGGS